MSTPGPFTLRSQRLGCLPIVNFFLTRIGLAEHLQAYLPADDPRLRLTPAAVIAVVVRNIVAGHRPVYALGEWAGPYDPAVLGLAPGEAQLLNDDRVVRTLDRLFDCDRASLITQTVLGVIRDFTIDTTQLHNDTTTDRDWRLPRRGRARPRRETDAGDPPGTQQGLPPRPETTAVHPHHLRRWCGPDRLPGRRRQHPRRPHPRADLGRTARPARAAGVPLRRGQQTVLETGDGSHPQSWWTVRHDRAARAARGHLVPGLGSNARAGLGPGPAGPRRTPRRPRPDWRTFQAPAPSVDGYRVIWVHSSSKAARDAGARAARIEAGLGAIDAVQARLASPKSRIKTRVAAEQAATTALQSAGATCWVGYTITETIEVDHRQEKRGRPGSTTRYRRTEKPLLTITAAVHAQNVSYDAVTDGCFPLITNDTVMTAADVLAAYHYQPNLERRNHLLKGAQELAPVYLETAHRIEALLLCHFLAMLTEALIEREIRTAMSSKGLDGIPLYPELRNCPAPSAPRILEIFTDLQRHQLINQDGQIEQTFQPHLSDLQRQVLDLLHTPTSIYNSTDVP